jgi:predicted secreted protein
MKLGMNRWSMTNNWVVYYDNIKIGRNVTYNDVAPTASGNQSPVANAGTDKTLTLPTNSTTLTGSGTDADGTIASYAWTRVSGPTTFTLGTANAATTTLSNLVAGTYVFRLTVTDNAGATSTDDVTVTVNAAANLSPSANAGSDITLTLPVNSTTLTGSGTDPDGTIASYAWARVSGPATFTLGTANAATTTLSNLVAGTYVFRLTVTDNGGATATDNVTVIVNASTPGNQAPTANAGADITITLPVNSTTLNGSGTDPDGTIASYAWARVSGPATFTLGTANAVTTTISNLVAGVYVFRLTVTDNSGTAAIDNVTVTVNNAATAGNQAPVARTGTDIVMTSPINSTELSGANSTDPDGVITAYEWTQVSGPSQIAIVNRLSADVSIDALLIGEYIFSLKVTDNNGASSTATMKVTVKSKSAGDINFDLYPNPSSGVLNMRYSDNKTGKVRLSVYDATRRLVKDEITDKTQTTLTKTVDVNILKGGVYILQIILPDGRTSAKLFMRE